MWNKDIIEFLDDSLGGASVYSPSGYNFLINLDKEANPILDVSCNKSIIIKIKTNF